MPLPNPSMNFTPLDPLAAAELNDIVENIEALQDGSSDLTLPADSVNATNIETLPNLRQDSTSNSSKASVILTGWGVITATAASFAFETVTFGVTFVTRPIVILTFGGDDTAGGTSYGDGGAERKIAATRAYAITTTSFNASFNTTDATNWTAGDTIFYQWMAIGELV